MTHTNGDQTDTQVQQVLEALRDYQDAHPAAQVDARRQNSVSVRIRIIDPAFAGQDRVDREPAVWRLLNTLPEDVFSNITMLLLITPAEAEHSLANLEFEDPIPSRL